MAALEYCDCPNYAAILFRRTYSDLALPGALIPRSHEWLNGTGAVWHEQAKTWSFPSGATLSFGYLDSENDKYRYQSSEFQFIGFDELTQFSLSTYTYMFSRLRRKEGSSIPLRMRAASNPGGIGHEWVKERFLLGGKSGAGRLFIRARLEDNPYLDANEYEVMLDELDPITRAQLRWGDWDVAVAGNLFKDEFFPRIHRRVLPEGLRLVRFWDLAATEEKPGQDPDYTAGLLMAKCPKNLEYIVDVRRTRAEPRVVEELIRETAQIDRQMFGSVSTFVEQEGGASGKTVIDHYVRNVLHGYDARGRRVTANKYHRAKPLSAQCARGNVSIVEGHWNADFISEVVSFPNVGVHDDQVDAASGAFNELIDDKWGAN